MTIWVLDLVKGWSFTGGLDNHSSGYDLYSSVRVDSRLFAGGYTHWRLSVMILRLGLKQETFEGWLHLHCIFELPLEINLENRVVGATCDTSPCDDFTWGWFFFWGSVTLAFSAFQKWNDMAKYVNRISMVQSGGRFQWLSVGGEKVFAKDPTNSWAFW